MGRALQRSSLRTAARCAARADAGPVRASRRRLSSDRARVCHSYMNTARCSPLCISCTAWRPTHFATLRLRAGARHSRITVRRGAARWIRCSWLRPVLYTSFLGCCFLVGFGVLFSWHLCGVHGHVEHSPVARLCCASGSTRGHGNVDRYPGGGVQPLKRSLMQGSVDCCGVRATAILAGNGSVHL